MSRAIRSSAPALDPTTLWQRDRSQPLKIPPDKNHLSPYSCSLASTDHLARLCLVARLAVHSGVTFISHVFPEQLRVCVNQCRICFCMCMFQSSETSRITFVLLGNCVAFSQTAIQRRYSQLFTQWRDWLAGLFLIIEFFFGSSLINVDSTSSSYLRVAPFSFFIAPHRFSTHSFHEVDHQQRRLVDLSHNEGKWLAVFC